MIIQMVKFKSALSEQEVLAVAKARFPEFRAIPGLIQKYYVKLQQEDMYGGVYVWDSKESAAAYRQSDLAASIPEAYKVLGKPVIELYEVFDQLRE